MRSLFRVIIQATATMSALQLARCGVSSACMEGVSVISGCVCVAACLLTGKIPWELSSLTALTTLDLDHNQLSGEYEAVS